MPGKHGLHLFTAVSLFAGAGLFQFATPLAISAQSRATIQVGATVVSAAGAWEADALVTSLARELGRALAAEPSGPPAQARTTDGVGAFPAATSGAGRIHPTLATLGEGFRREWRGTVVRVEVPPSSRTPGTLLVTVAHLAN